MNNANKKLSLRVFTLLVCLLLPIGIGAQEEEEGQEQGQDSPDGLKITGLPLPSYNDDIGFTYGLRGIGTYYEEGHDPYLFQLWAQGLWSTKGFEDHAIRLDYLDFFGTRVKAKLAYERTLTAQYYGIGNFQDIQRIERVRTGETPVGENLPTRPITVQGADLADSLDIVDTRFGDEYNYNENLLYDPIGNIQNGTAVQTGRRIYRERQNRFYNFDRVRPNLTASVEDWFVDNQGGFFSNFKWFAGVRLQRYKILSYYGDKEKGEAEYNSLTLLDIEQPIGYDAVATGERRYVNSGRLAIAYDSRPRVRENNPNEGIFADLHLEAAGKGTGSHYTFSRATFTWRQYVEILHDFMSDYGQETVLAYRVLWQETFGDAPFFELNRVYTINEESEGLGGSGGLRGYPSNQFVDNVMTMANLEVRHTFSRVSWLGGIDWQLLYFYDIGRVAESRTDWTTKGMHKAWGPGISMVWQRNTIVTIFLGRSEFESFTAFKLSHMF